MNLRHLTVITQDAASSSLLSLHHLKTHCLFVEACCQHSDAEIDVRLQCNSQLCVQSVWQQRR